MHLNEWFEKGISPGTYRSHLDKHDEHFHQIYNNFSVPAEDLPLLKNKANLRVVALAEVWCGHCMLDVPILLRMTEAAGIPVSMLPRDEHLELMDQYVTNGKRYIPIFIFIDEDGNEVGKWGPMAPTVQELVDRLKEEANVPDKEDPGYKEAFKKYADEISDTFTQDETIWQAVYEDIKKSLP